MLTSYPRFTSTKLPALTPAEREGVQALRKCLQNNHNTTSKSHGVEAEEAERLLAWLQEREQEE